MSQRAAIIPVFATSVALLIDCLQSVPAGWNLKRIFMLAWLPRLVDIDVPITSRSVVVKHLLITAQPAILGR